MSMNPESEGYLENITIGNLESLLEDNEVSLLLRQAINQMISAFNKGDLGLAYELSSVYRLIAVGSGYLEDTYGFIDKSSGNLDAFSEIEEFHGIIASRLKKLPSCETWFIAQALHRETAITYNNISNDVINRMDMEFQRLSNQDPTHFKEQLECVRHDLERFKLVVKH